MCYYTIYQLEIRSKDLLTKDMMSQINRTFCDLWWDTPFERTDWSRINTSDEAFEQSDFIQTSFLNEEQKWYNWHEDMTKLSKSFPSVGFILCGDGEDLDDNWMATFLGGKSEISHGNIIFEYNSLEDVMRHWKIN